MGKRQRRRFLAKIIIKLSKIPENLNFLYSCLSGAVHASLGQTAVS
jgi:hypothetical protein